MQQTLGVHEFRLHEARFYHASEWYMTCSHMELCCGVNLNHAVLGTGLSVREPSQWPSSHTSGWFYALGCGISLWRANYALWVCLRIWEPEKSFGPPLWDCHGSPKIDLLHFVQRWNFKWIEVFQVSKNWQEPLCINHCDSIYLRANIIPL